MVPGDPGVAPHMLLLAATPLESDWLAASLGLEPLPDGWAHGTWKGKPIHLIVSGIGPMNAAFALGKYLASQRPHLILQFGIAGTYPTATPLALLDVVQVVTDCYADLGATLPDGEMLDMEAMGFPLGHLPSGEPIYNVMKNPQPLALDIPQVRGLTSATVSGHSTLIAERLRRWSPQVESMEGAVCFQHALQRGISFAQLRCISNAVAPRDPASWQIPLACRRMQEFILGQMAFLCA